MPFYFSTMCNPTSVVISGNIIPVNVSFTEYLDQWKTNSGKIVSSTFFLTDENTRKHCLIKLFPSHEIIGDHIISVKSGETSKSIDNVSIIIGKLLNLGADRNSLLINLGGGMISDLGGFTASVFKRGISFINIPTSLMAMIDASLGGKTGVNIRTIKNQAGTFYNPEFVFIDPAFLETLPDHQMVSGLAEMIKHGLIFDFQYWIQLNHFVSNLKNLTPKADPQLEITENPDSPDHLSNNSFPHQFLNNAFRLWENDEFKQLIYKSIEIKLALVAQDPFDYNQRKILNFGHTIGHALEAFSLDGNRKELTHGHAVALGMICESWLSMHLSGLPVDEFQQIVSLIRSIFPIYDFADVNYPEILELIKSDKKNHSGIFSFALLKQTGEGLSGVPVTIPQIIQSLDFYKSLK